MIRKVLIFAVVVIAMFMNSCATTGQIATKAIKVTEGRAPFDMGCDEVSGQLLGDVTYPVPNMAEMNIGVTGCGGKKASYMTRCSPGNWGSIVCTPHLNSITGGKSLTDTEE
ncbi:MAG: hypothetical protein LBB56_00510 [Chitinispirillales bacterium]|jgi:hypothetical protein|nr:hypothetical protein [Chitinispirillales bacterium]